VSVGIGKLRFVELHFAGAFVFQLGSLIADTNHASIQLCAIAIFMHNEASLPINSRANETDTCYTTDSLIYQPLTPSIGVPPPKKRSQLCDLAAKHSSCQHEGSPLQGVGNHEFASTQHKVRQGKGREGEGRLGPSRAIFLYINILVQSLRQAVTALVHGVFDKHVLQL
jgi:hypothetical protein